MNVYKVSCYSRCNSYCSGYLQSVIVIADTQEDAVNVVKKSKPYKEYGFIYPEKDWGVRLMHTDIQNNAVIDYHYDSDY